MQWMRLTANQTMQKNDKLEDTANKTQRKD